MSKQVKPPVPRGRVSPHAKAADSPPEGKVAGIPHNGDKRIKHDLHQGRHAEHSLSTMSQPKTNNQAKIPDVAERMDADWADWEGTDAQPNNTGYGKR